MTLLDFQLSTDNQDGRHLVRIFFTLNFFRIPLKPDIFRFSGSATLLALSIFMRDRKRGYGGHFGFINFNKFFLFSVKCLETWHNNMDDFKMATDKSMHPPEIPD